MHTRLWTSVLACVALAVVRAQQPVPAPESQQPTFRAGANYVRVDMYAAAEGRPIEDLKPEEIELREDGVVQKIETFEHVHVRTATPEAARVEPNTVRDSRQMAADPRARVFVIFLDTYNTQVEGSAHMREPLLRFIDRVLGPDDLVAVMRPEMSAADVTFARKTAVIEKMLQQDWDWGTKGRNVPMDDTESLYEFCYPGPIAEEMKARRREKLTLDALDDLVTVLGGVREERKAVLTVSDGWMQYRENPALARGGGKSLAPPGVFGPGAQPNDTGQDSRTTRNGVARCEADRLALSQLDDSQRLIRMTQRANRGNVSFYTISARGLVVFDSPIGPAPPPSIQQDAANLRTKENSLRFIADDTDGMAIVSTNQINAGVDRIVADLSSYYLLGYYSTNTKLDGKFRSISVSVRRPKVQVRARRGYLALTPGEVARPVPRATASNGATADVKPRAVVVDPGAPFRIRTSSWAAAVTGDTPSGRLWIVGELDARTRKEAGWTGGAQADVAVVAADGRTVMARTVDVAASEGAFSLRVPETGSVAPGEYSVRVRLKPQAGSGTSLSDVARVTVPASATSIGEPVMSRRGPATGPRYVVTADPRFTRSERLRLEFPTRAGTMATATLLDGSGRPTAVPVQVSERVDAGSDARWIVADVNLAPLGAGDYAVDMSAGGSRQLVEFRVVP